jgi:hypothetical protein
LDLDLTLDNPSLAYLERNLPFPGSKCKEPTVHDRPSCAAAENPGQIFEEMPASCRCSLTTTPVKPLRVCPKSGFRGALAGLPVHDFADVVVRSEAKQQIEKRD